jgi:gliding motility-associated-like protein
VILFLKFCFSIYTNQTRTMKKLLSIIIAICALSYSVFGQCGSGPVLTVNNPSFEGPTQPHLTPPGWDICMPGVTPDTQPGSWGVNLPPSNGNSYIGLVYAPSINWQEGAGQTLSSPMIAGTTYSFTIDLATPASANPSTGIILPPWCEQLQLWGGMSGVNSGCDQAELLWTSPVVTNTTWQTYNLVFTPTSNWNHILFNIYAVLPACTDGQYIMMDNMSPISPMADVANFSADSVCIGSTTHFTDHSVSLSGSITNWNYNFGDGSPNSTLQNPTHVYTTPGTYNVTLTTYSNVPCTTTVVKPIIVFPLPTVTATANPPALCSGLAVTLTAAGATTYAWSNGIGTGNPVVVNPNTTTTYTVTGTANGCTGSTTVTVNMGILSVSGQVVNHVSCFNGANGSASVSILSGTPPYTYAWSPSGGNGSTASGLTAGTYVVTVNDSLGCQDTAMITIAEPPLLSANITDSLNVMCYSGSTGSATVTASGGTLPYTYNWSPAGGSSNVALNLIAGVYYVTVTDSKGCTATDQVTIHQSPAITIALTPNDETCQNSCNGSIVSIVNGGIPPYTYLWNTNPSQTTSGATGLCSGSYTVSVTDSLHCVATASTSVSVSSAVTADFTANPPTGVIPLTVNFYYSGTGADTYYWDFGDGSTGTGLNPSHIYTHDGSYTVILTVYSAAPDSCTDTYTIVITAILPSVLVVPNVFTPNADGFNDEFKPEQVAIKTLHAIVYDRWGKKIAEWNDPDGSWNGRTKNGQNCADGTYYYILEAEGFDAVKYNLNGTITLMR